MRIAKASLVTVVLISLACTSAASKVDSVVVIEQTDGYEITVPISQLVMTIPGEGLSRSDGPRKDATASRRYFLLENRTQLLSVSGWFEPEQDFPASGIVNPDVDGLTAGALLAYRSGKLGFDVELGIADVSGGEVPADGGFTEFEAEWLSRARLTLSHPVGNTLLFAAAGGAAMRFYVNDAFTEETAPEVLIQDPRFVTLTGWTIGAGAERMMRERISLRVEAIYDSFGGEDLSENPGEGRIEPTSTTIRAAILFRF